MAGEKRRLTKDELRSLLQRVLTGDDKEFGCASMTNSIGDGGVIEFDQNEARLADAAGTVYLIMPLLSENEPHFMVIL